MTRAPVAAVLAAVATSLTLGCAAETPPERAPEETVSLPPSLSGMGGELVRLAARVRPSLVRIHSEAQVLKPASRYLSGLASGFVALVNPYPYWDWPYRIIRFPFYLLFGYLDLSDSYGSGFFVGKGLVLTNAHVIDNAESIHCQKVDGAQADASLLLVDQELDLALLRVKGLSGPPLRLRRHGSVPAEPVLAVGFPLREAMTAPFAVRFDTTHLRPNPRCTGGIVTAVKVELGNPRTRYLELDAALNPGNSGGPVLGLDGTVVGIATMVGVGKQNEGYAVPAATILRAFGGHLGRREPAPTATGDGPNAGNQRGTHR